MRIADCSLEYPLNCITDALAENVSSPVQIAVEHRMEVYLREKLALRLTCTPEHLDELVLGCLLTEGLIRCVSDVERIHISENGIKADVLLRDDAAKRLAGPGSETSETCFPDPPGSFSCIRKDIIPVEPIQWDALWLFSAAEQLLTQQKFYEATHAIHACGLFSGDRLLCCREDIGRHNALDKAVGWALRTGADLSRCMLFTTGRLPADMVAKAIRAGIPLLCSKTFPTDKGIELARRARLSLVTIRPDREIFIWNHDRK